VVTPDTFSSLESSQQQTVAAVAVLQSRSRQQCSKACHIRIFNLIDPSVWFNVLTKALLPQSEIDKGKEGPKGTKQNTVQKRQQKPTSPTKGHSKWSQVINSPSQTKLPQKRHKASGLAPISFCGFVL